MAVIPLVLSLLLVAVASVPNEGPCDIYLRGETPCVAAHSMTRALYGLYAGPLYTVWSADANQTKDITVSPGGVADTAAQEAFCGHSSSSSCVVTRIWDQSPNGNHLGIEKGPTWFKPPRGGQDNGVGFTDDRSKATLGGHPVFSALFDNGNAAHIQYGYSNRTAQGTATGDEPQSIYAVLSGKVFNGGCCFARHDSAEHFSRLDALLFTAMG